jgi:hypothetical protein
MSMDSPSLDPDERMAVALLDHDGLMTPVLTRRFGPLRAEQHLSDLSGDTLHRHSTIRTHPGGEAILAARLDIHVPALPDGLLDRLGSGMVLFGQLLLDEGIDVQVQDRHLYRVGEGGAPETRWGRRLTMQRRDTGMLVCKVDELLVPVRDLTRLAAARRR